MDSCEYLLSYGKTADFGCFCSPQPLASVRGDRLVVQSTRGLEIGTVMRQASQEHARLLAGQYLGRILRRASAEDDRTAERMAERSQVLFTQSRRLVADLHLPMEVLDAEVLLDGRQAVLHYVRWAGCDPRPLMDELGEQFRLLVTLHNLGTAAGGGAAEEEGACGPGGCGSGGCGSCQAGKCSSCRVPERLEASRGRRVPSPAQAVPVADAAARSALFVPSTSTAKPADRLSLL